MSATKIYEYISTKRYSHAQPLLSAELRKNPSSVVYQSLDAFLAHKLNDKTKSLGILESILAAKGSNSPVVTTLLAPILLSYNNPVLLNTAFEQANRKTPNDKPLVAAWIECALIIGDTKMLCKSLLANNRQQQNRKSTYQACFAMYLTWSAAADHEPERKLYPNLAAKMLEPHLPPTSSEEFFTAHTVKSMGQRVADMIISSKYKLALNTLQRVLDELESSERWQDLYDHALAFLETADSFNCWQALNTAAVHLDQSQAVEEYASRFKSVNSQLAIIDLHTKMNMNTFPLLTKFWSKNQTKMSAFEYLSQYLDVPGFSEFVQSEQADTFTGKVHLIKLRYLMKQEVDVEELIKLYHDNLAELPQEKTDYFIGSDLMMLAAIQLLKSGYKYRALALLEHALDNDPSNFYIRLWLIVLFRHLGIMEKAAHHYSSMTIKNVQHESFGHLLVSRGGSLGLCSEQFGVLRKMYVQCDNMFSATNLALDEQVYCQLESMLELQRRFNCSLTRAVANIEELRATRLTRGESDPSPVINITPDLKDNRDETTFFDPCHELVSLKLEPRITEQWVQSQVARENAFLETLRGKTGAFDAIDTSDFTDAERWSIDCLRANSLIHPMPSLDRSNMTWELIHNGYTIAETMRLLSDIGLKSGKKQNFKQHRSETKERIQKAQQFSPDFSSDIEWCNERNIKVAEQVLGGIKKLRSRALSNIVTALK